MGRAVSATSVLYVLVVLLLPGCALPGAIAYKVFGPPPIPARYTPPKEPMLVMVEEAHASGGAILESEELAMAIQQQLRENDVAPLVETQQVQRLRDANPTAFRQMGISEIGRNVGAKQVLYVAIRRLDLDAPQSADVMRAQLSVELKMIDTQTAQVRWPESGDAETYEYETDYQRLTPQNPPVLIRSSAIRHAAVDIGRMFYKWKPETMQEENQDLRIR